MLSGAQWSVLEPLVEACRPKGKTPPQEFRRTVSAILWRHRRGAKWRAVPADFGPWWQAAQIFIRWTRLGVRERLFNLVEERGVQLGIVFLDGTNIRAHQKAVRARGNITAAPPLPRPASSVVGRPIWQTAMAGTSDCATAILATICQRS